MKYREALARAVGGAVAGVASYKLFCPWLGNDLADIKVLLSAYRRGFYYPNQGIWMVDILEITSEKYPDKYFIIHDDRVYTYRQVMDQANRVAHVIKQWGILKGATVAIMMHNEPGYVWTMFGLLKCGLKVSLININLRNESLIHCIKCCDVTMVIVSAQDKNSVQAIHDVSHQLPGVTIVFHGESDYPSNYHRNRPLILPESTMSTIPPSTSSKQSGMLSESTIGTIQPDLSKKQPGMTSGSHSHDTELTIQAKPGHQKCVLSEDSQDEGNTTPSLFHDKEPRLDTICSERNASLPEKDIPIDNQRTVAANNSGNNQLNHTEHLPVDVNNSHGDKLSSRNDQPNTTTSQTRQVRTHSDPSTLNNQQLNAQTYNYQSYNTSSHSSVVTHNETNRPSEHCRNSIGQENSGVSSPIQTCPLTNQSTKLTSQSQASLTTTGVNQGAPLSPPYVSLTQAMASAPTSPTPKEWRQPINQHDVMCYIFTSGTTGLPKASVQTQIKCVLGAGVMEFSGKMDTSDVVYITMPLYHSAPMAVGLFSVIVHGATAVIKTKFSASEYWDDCRRHNVTIIQYIGELCRYLLAQPPNDLDGKHSIKRAIGNGLRKDIWSDFVTRFKIPHLVELFAASEGTAIIFNQFNKVGAIGRYSPLMRLLDKTPKFWARYDPHTYEPMRDKGGRCIHVGVGEPGLFLSQFPPFLVAGLQYKGDKALNDKKIIRNVMHEGDMYFNFGDLMYRDKEYFIYFSDRIGDTFRWQGENVSTQEVADVLTSLEFINDACVYGVHIPGRDGRAGMAMLSLTNNQPHFTNTDLRSMYEKSVKSLAKYARPIFLRHQNEIPTTETMKQRKVDLIKEAFYPDKTADPIYVIDHNNKTYTRLTQDLLKDMVLSGASRL